jgi:hypothetical protein
MLRGALAFFSRRKLQLKSRDPTNCDWMIDLTTYADNVNAMKRNKTVIVDSTPSRQMDSSFGRQFQE